ncbi:helix-turn-helix transcriptional regulator [Dactylosporangium maewongense]|uniref:Helix-turn-helix transcriptional regulator n=1 Tax=Dactylosporangium maewongense TaxID=634393 RepID=A0ABN1ZYA8_9ACTN
MEAMGSLNPRFGAELRRRREDAGWSLSRFAAKVHYTKGYLSKVETGQRPVNVEFARRCDAALECEGELAALVEPVVAGAPAPPAAEGDGVWVLTMDALGGGGFAVASRRGLLRWAASAMLPPGLRRIVAPEPGPAHGADRSALEGFRAMFEQVRALGQHADSEILLPILVAQTNALRVLGVRLSGRERDDAWLLGSRYAEYLGWMAQESGRDQEAAWWTGQAVEFARNGNDREMAVYAQVRRALITMYQGDAAATIALARQARETPCRPRIRGLAAQREAQGHALAGDHRACLHALDAARELLASDPGDDGPVLGSSNVPDVVAMSTGWALLDLGRPGPAAETIRGQLALVPPGARRTRARYGTRLARALAVSGQLDEACVVAGQALDDYDRLGSATIRADLRELARTLRRWPSHRDARVVSRRLTTALWSPDGSAPGAA